MQKESQKKIIIFDLGGVILFFSHQKICLSLSEVSGIPVDKIYGFIFESGLEKMYDEGKISSMEFIKKISTILKINLSFDEFELLWADIFTENPDVIQVINELKKNKFEIYLLSNTNELHFNFVLRKFRILKEIDKYILSFHVHERKPAPEMFQEAIKLSGLKADNLIFIDDREENTIAANMMGINTILYNPEVNLKNILNIFGVII